MDGRTYAMAHTNARKRLRTSSSPSPAVHSPGSTTLCTSKTPKAQGLKQSSPLAKVTLRKRPSAGAAAAAVTVVSSATGVVPGAYPQDDTGALGHESSWDLPVSSGFVGRMTLSSAGVREQRHFDYTPHYTHPSPVENGWPLTHQPGPYFSAGLESDIAFPQPMPYFPSGEHLSQSQSFVSFCATAVSHGTIVPPPTSAGTVDMPGTALDHPSLFNNDPVHVQLDPLWQASQPMTPYYSQPTMLNYDDEIGDWTLVEPPPGHSDPSGGISRSTSGDDIVDEALYLDIVSDGTLADEAFTAPLALQPDPPRKHSRKPLEPKPREETQETRRLKACVRCRMQKIRVSKSPSSQVTSSFVPPSIHPREIVQTRPQRPWRRGL
jgi:hypothetical protein